MLKTVIQHSTGGATAVEFSSNNLLLGSAGQKSIHLFHNVKGVRALNEDLRQKFKAAGSNAGMKGRIVEQIKSNEWAEFTYFLLRIIY